MLYAGALRLKLPLNGNEFLQAYVSRTEYPEWAIPCLKLFEVVEGITAYDLAPQQVREPGLGLRGVKPLSPCRCEGRRREFIYLLAWFHWHATP